jgi:hypothetical protein
MGVPVAAPLVAMGVAVAAPLGVLVGAHVRQNLVAPNLPPPSEPLKRELFHTVTISLGRESLRARGARGNMGHV